MAQAIFLDIMEHGRFLCQLRYTKRGWPRIVDGKIIEVHDSGDIERFVYEQRPSLKGRDIKILFSNNRV